MATTEIILVDKITNKIVSDKVTKSVLLTCGIQGPPGASGGAPYSNTNPTPDPVGGIPAGSTFDDVLLQEMWDALLYPFQAPSFSSFAMSGRIAVIEVGDTLIGGVKTFTWGINEPDNIKPNTISVSSTTEGTIASGLANDGTEDLDIGLDLIRTSAYTQVWTIRCESLEDVIFSRSISTSWRWRNNYGYSENTELTGQEILDLQSNALKTSRAGTYTVTPAGYKYIAWPTIFGLPSSVKDLDGYDIAAAPIDTVSVTNAFGVTQDFYVFRTLYYQNGEVTMVVT